MMMVCRLDDSGQAEEPESLEEEGVLELIAQGLAVLTPKQSLPPYAVLDLFERRSHDIESFGPKADDPVVWKRISAGLFNGGSRMSIAEGLEVPWYASGNSLLKAAGMYLSQCDVRPNNLHAQIAAVMREYLTKRARHFTVNGRPASEELRQRSWILGDPVNLSDGMRRCFEVSPEWFEFHVRLQKAEQGMRAMVSAALAEGRILVSETSHGGDRLLGPTAAAKIKYWSSSTEANFCFSADLPKAWFPKEKHLTKQIGKAWRWMRRVEEEFAKTDRRVRGDDLITGAKGKFGLTTNAARQALAQAREDHAPPSGRIPRDRYVDFNEINDIN